MATEGVFVDRSGAIRQTGVKAMVPKLNDDNFLIWKRNILMYCEIFGAEHHLYEDKCRKPKVDLSRVEWLYAPAECEVLYDKCYEAEWTRKEEIASEAILATIPDQQGLFREMEREGLVGDSCTAYKLLKYLTLRHSNTVPSEYQQSWELWTTMRWDNRDDFFSFCDEWEYRLLLVQRSRREGPAPILPKETQAIQFLTVIKACGQFDEWLENQLTPEKDGELPPVAELVASARDNWRQRQQPKPCRACGDKHRNPEPSSSGPQPSAVSHQLVPVHSQPAPTNVHPAPVNRPQQQGQVAMRDPTSLSIRERYLNCVGCGEALLESTQRALVYSDIMSMRVFGRILSESDYCLNPWAADDNSNAEACQDGNAKMECDCCGSREHNVDNCFHLHPELFKPNMMLVDDYKKLQGHGTEATKSSQKLVRRNSM